MEPPPGPCLQDRLLCPCKKGTKDCVLFYSNLQHLFFPLIFSLLFVLFFRSLSVDLLALWPDSKGAGMPDVSTEVLPSLFRAALLLCGIWDARGQTTATKSVYVWETGAPTWRRMMKSLLKLSMECHSQSMNVFSKVEVLIPSRNMKGCINSVFH